MTTTTEMTLIDVRRWLQLPADPPADGFPDVAQAIWGLQMSESTLIALQPDLDAALALLRRLEKRGPGGDCPSCRRFGVGERHYPDCELAALLTAHPEPRS